MQGQYAKIGGERFIVDMMYARKNNMVGCAVYQKIGWGNFAVAHIDLLERLERLVPKLQKERMKLKICDAYRPRAAHEMMKKIIPMKGFFAESAELSQHCWGTAVDVCLCDEDGKEFDYPTKVDAYDENFARQVSKGKMEAFKKHLQKARCDYAAKDLEAEIANRDFLQQIMKEAGFASIMHEWWHFNLPGGRNDTYPLPELNVADYL